METLAFYRKYRPQSLNDLIGQDKVKQILQNAFSMSKLSHAYLFTGPRGCGKTSTARILAKMVNCENSSELGVRSDDEKEKSPNPKPQTPNIPCNTCQTCLTITDGSNLDLIEIDAASNRGIDDIRELRERIKLSPSSSKKKIYIIDEVHMLTSEAFNALLKTLEEPPSHVLFILATTEAHKVPATILSRVQRLDFKLATIAELITALKKITKQEKLTIDDSALTLIAKKAEGSYRDAVKLLDQIASGGGEMNSQTVEESLKGGKFETITSLLESIIGKDPKSSLQKIVSATSSGLNTKEFITDTMDLLRSMLFIKHNVGDLIKLDLGEEKFAEVSSLAEKISIDELIAILDCFQEGLERLRTASIPTLPLEVAVVTACQRGKKAIVQTIQQVIYQPTQPVSSPVINIDSPRSTPVEAGQRTSEPTSSEDLLILKEKWNYVLETIKPYNFSLEALLRSAKLFEISEGIVTLEVPYSFHQRILETPRNRDVLESVLSDVLGKEVKVGCKIGKRPTRVDDIANVDLAADDEIIKIAAEIFNSDSAN